MKRLFFWEIKMSGVEQWSLHPTAYFTYREAVNAIPSFHKVMGHESRVVEYERQD